MKLRVVIIEDTRELREGLQSLLNLTPNFSCVKVYRTMEEALRDIDAAKIDLVLTDLGLPGMDGIEGTRRLREACG